MNYFIKCTEKLTNTEYCITYLDVLLKAELVISDACYPFKSKEDAQSFLDTKLIDNTEFTYEEYNIEVLSK